MTPPGYSPSHCCSCGHKFYIRPSLSMTELSINSGVATCPKCDLFLHIEMLEGEMSTEDFQSYLKRTNNLQPVGD